MMNIRTRKSERKRWFTRLLVALFLLACSSGCWAQSYIAYCWGGLQPGNPAFDYPISLPSTVTVQPNAAIGTVLATATLSLNSGMWTCRSDTPTMQTGTAIGSTTGTYVDTYTIGGRPAVVYSTNVPGVGYALTLSKLYNKGCGGSVVVPAYVTPEKFVAMTCLTRGYNDGIAGDYQINLVKIGPITPGVLTPGPIGRGSLMQDGNLVSIQGIFNFHLAAPVQIDDGSGTCSFTVPDRDLGTYTASSFTGSTMTLWSNAISVQIVSCAPGIQNIRMKFLGTPDAINSDYFAPISTSGNVTGVAIQLANSFMAPVTPGASIDWSRAALGDAYNLRARLVQTQSVVTPGTMKTPVTIQFTYY